MGRSIHLGRHGRMSQMIRADRSRILGTTDRSHVSHRYHHSQAESGTRSAHIGFRYSQGQRSHLSWPRLRYFMPHTSTSCTSTNRISAPTTLPAFTVAKEIVPVARADSRCREIEKGKSIKLRIQNWGYSSSSPTTPFGSPDQSRSVLRRAP